MMRRFVVSVSYLVNCPLGLYIGGKTSATPLLPVLTLPATLARGEWPACQGFEYFSPNYETAQNRACWRLAVVKFDTSLKIVLTKVDLSHQVWFKRAASPEDS